MSDRPPNELPARDAATQIAAGHLTAETLTRACLDQIAAREDVVGAWTFLDPDKAISEAQALDTGPRRGPLHGLPVGVKDVIDTADMPTEQGSPIHAGRRPDADAACVARLRAAGAIVLGKTVTTEFAAMTAGKTVNPHDPDRIPGGSSSGSAAAVADFMVPLALGTQTVGSTIRPAAYCGIVGFKPTYGTFNLSGVAAQARSLDTLGLMARTVADIVLLAGGLTGGTSTFAQSPVRGSPRIGFCRSPHWPGVEPATVAAMDRTVDDLRKGGAIVTDVELPVKFTEVLDAQWTILGYEFARNLADERAHHADLISEPLMALLTQGAAIPDKDYDAALTLAADCRGSITAFFADCDVLLTPSAAGEAPEMGATTDLLFQRLWTVLHLPCLTLPAYVGPGGLPVGVQLVGPSGWDARLLAIADWMERLLCPVGPTQLAGATA